MGGKNTIVICLFAVFNDGAGYAFGDSCGGVFGFFGGVFRQILDYIVHIVVVYIVVVVDIVIDQFLVLLVVLLICFSDYNYLHIDFVVNDYMFLLD